MVASLFGALVVQVYQHQSTTKRSSMNKLHVHLRCRFSRSRHAISKFYSSAVLKSQSPIAESIAISSPAFASQRKEPNPVNQDEAHDFEVRLTNISNILMRRGSSLEQRSFEIHQMYSRSGGNLVQDLAQNEKRSLQMLDMNYSSDKYSLAVYSALNDVLGDTIKDWLWENVYECTSTGAMVLNQLLESIQKKEYLSAFELLVFLFDLRDATHSKVVLKEMDLVRLKLLQGKRMATEDEKSLCSSLSSLCIQFAISLEQPLVACLLLHTCLESNITIGSTTIEEILVSLSIDRPLHSNYQSYAIIKTILRLKTSFLSPSFYFKLIGNMSKGSRDPYFANILFLHVVEKLRFFENARGIDISPIRFLIECNLQNDNSHRAREIWKVCYEYDPSFALKFANLFNQLFIATDDKSEKLALIENYLPSELLTHSSIFGTILAFYGRDLCFLDNFRDLSSHINPPVSRSLLSVLLASFITQGKEKEVRLLMKAIAGAQGGFSPHDIDILVERLLSQSDLNGAMNLLIQNHITASKEGYLRVIKHLLAEDLRGSDVPTSLPDISLQTKIEHSIPEFDANLTNVASQRSQTQPIYANPILNFAAHQLSILNSDTVHRDFTLALVDYLGKKYGSGVSRRLYMNKDRKRAQGYTFDFVKFNLPKRFTDLLRMNESNHIRALESILEVAKGENNTASIKWCVLELRKLGVFADDIAKNSFAA